MSRLGILAVVGAAMLAIAPVPTAGGEGTGSELTPTKAVSNPAGLYARMTSIPISSVPEPVAMLLLGVGLTGLAYRLRRRR